MTLDCQDIRGVAQVRPCDVTFIGSCLCGISCSVAYCIRAHGMSCCGIGLMAISDKLGHCNRWQAMHVVGCHHE